MDPDASLYAVIEFEGDRQRQVRQVAVMFASVSDADRYVDHAGLDDVTVAPVHFPHAAAPLAGGHAAPGTGRDVPAVGVSPGDGAVRPVRIELEHSTTVAVDGTVVADPEPTFPAPSLPAVTMRMPGFVAHTLAHVLAGWTRVCELVGAGTRVDWWRQAQALHDAAHATGSPEAACCPATGSGLATSLGAHPDR